MSLYTMWCGRRICSRIVQQFELQSQILNKRNNSWRTPFIINGRVVLRVRYLTQRHLTQKPDCGALWEQPSKLWLGALRVTISRWLRCTGAPLSTPHRGGQTFFPFSEMLFSHSSKVCRFFGLCELTVFKEIFYWYLLVSIKWWQNLFSFQNIQGDK